MRNKDAEYYSKITLCYKITYTNNGTQYGKIVGAHDGRSEENIAGVEMNSGESFKGFSADDGIQSSKIIGVECDNIQVEDPSGVTDNNDQHRQHISGVEISLHT